MLGGAGRGSLGGASATGGGIGGSSLLAGRGGVARRRSPTASTGGWSPPASCTPASSTCSSTCSRSTSSAGCSSRRSGEAALRAHLLRVAARRLVRGAAARARRADRGRLGRDLRPDGRGRGRDAQPRDELMESGLGIWIVLNLVITFSVPNISIGGHIGGLIGGALAALVLFDLGDRVRRARGGAGAGVRRAGRRVAVVGRDRGVVERLGRRRRRQVQLDRAARVGRRHEVGVQQVARAAPGRPRAAGRGARSRRRRPRPPRARPARASRSRWRMRLGGRLLGVEAAGHRDHHLGRGGLDLRPLDRARLLAGEAEHVSPPASSIICGTQWPPDVDGVEPLERGHARARRVRHGAARPPRCGRPPPRPAARPPRRRPAASASRGTSASTSPSVEGSSEITCGRVGRRSATARTSSSDTAQTSQTAWVTIRSTLELRSAYSSSS